MPGAGLESTPFGHDRARHAGQRQRGEYRQHREAGADAAGSRPAAAEEQKQAQTEEHPAENSAPGGLGHPYPALPSDPRRSIADRGGKP